MQVNLLDFSEPRARILWSIASVVGILTYFVSRGVSWKSPQQDNRAIVQSVTGLSAKGGFGRTQLLGMALGFVFLGTAFGLMLWHVHERSRIGARDMIQIQLLAMCAFVFAPVVRYLATSGVREMEKKLRAADYQGALEQSDKLLRRFSDASSIYFLRGRTLFLVGRLAEAEQTIRVGLEKGQKAGRLQQAVGLYELGYVLLEQRRLTQAAEALEGSAKINVAQGAFEGMADVLLRQNEPTRALQFLDQAIAVKADRRSRYRRGGSLRAIRAHALAMLGRADEAAYDLEMALQATDRNSIPELAETYWRSGLALLAMDRGDEAIKQFELASGIDPKGLYASGDTQNRPSVDT